MTGFVNGETLHGLLIWGGALTLAGVGIITLREIQKHQPISAETSV